MEEIVLQTKNLTKRYGRFTALDHVTVTLKKKHIYGFIGENGAGKTTLMKIIAGLAFPTDGIFSIMGKENPHEREKMRRYIGCTIEAPAVIPGFTVLQNLEMQRTLTGNPDQAACNRVLEMVDLVPVKHKKVKTLSMGMKQRLSVALAMVGNPRILILDEPINGLDPKNIVALRKLLHKLCEERDMTIFISSHILSELYLLATDYIFIHKGCIVEILTQDELETKCRKYIRICTKSVPYVITVLETHLRQPEYKVVSETELHLYSDIEKTETIAGLLLEHQILVSEFSLSEQTLEEYFLTITAFW